MKKKEELLKESEEDFKGSILRLCIMILVLIMMSISLIIIRNNVINKQNQNYTTKGVEVIPTMLDEIPKDASWCPTFELIWQDLKNEVVKRDIVFNPQLKVVENLNASTFTTDDISDEYYYKTYGLKTIELKKTIEKAIKDKFNQTSDILDDFDWNEDELDNPNNSNMKRYFFYSMLYREFEYNYKFDKFKNEKFNDKYEGINYFGVDSNSNDSVRKQVEVLFYDDKDNFAVKLITKTGDEVILYKNPQGNTFASIYETLMEKEKSYIGPRYLKESEIFKTPIVKFNLKKEYTELENQPFKTADPLYDEATISKAIQTIKFEIDEKGGKVKSEAGMDVKNYATAIPEEIREFKVDKTYALFLKEIDKNKPYLAVRIDDITKFQ